MEQKIAVKREQVEKKIEVKREAFMLAESQTKTVPLSMANGDQIVSPDAGKLLSQVIIEKPNDLAPDSIRKGRNIGGIDGSYEGVVLPTLENPAKPYNVSQGYDYIDENGVRQVGIHYHPHLNNPAGAMQILEGYDAINDDNVRVAGHLAPLPTLDNPASYNDVVSGKQYVDENGVKRTGTLNVDFWQHSPFLFIRHVVVTTEANSVNTTLGVKDYIIEAAGTENGRLLAFSLREKASYTNNELGRCVLYPNSGIGYFSCTQWNGSAWVAGRMLSGYSAVLPAGNVYDVYYWGVPT